MRAGKVDIPSACKVCGANLSDDSAETCGDACAHSLRRSRVMRTIISAQPGDRAIMHHDDEGRVDAVLILRQSHAYFNVDAVGSLPEIARIRAKIAARPDTCGPNCPGWAVFNADSCPELDTCIECWSGIEDKLTLDEVEALPEAEHELALAVAAAEIETAVETLLYKHPRHTVPCGCGCTVFQVEGASERCSACATTRPHECHCAVPGSCEICKVPSLLDTCRALKHALWIQKENTRDGESRDELEGLIEEAEEIIALHEEEAKIPDQPVDRDSPIFVATLAAMDRAEEINGPEGDDYRQLMRAIEVEARTRRLNYDKE